MHACSIVTRVVSAKTEIGQIYFERCRTILDEIEGLADRLIDVVDEGFDLVVRIAELEDSSLIAGRIAPWSKNSLRSFVDFLVEYFGDNQD